LFPFSKVAILFFNVITTVPNRSVLDNTCLSLMHYSLKKLNSFLFFPEYLELLFSRDNIRAFRNIGLIHGAKL
jgi:hypothetical protein